MSKVDRSVRRLLISKIYNSAMGFLFNTYLSDYQCGFKALNRGKLLSIKDEVKNTHWFWDTEVLVLSNRHSIVSKRSRSRGLKAKIKKWSSSPTPLEWLVKLFNFGGG